MKCPLHDTEPCLFLSDVRSLLDGTADLSAKTRIELHLHRWEPMYEYVGRIDSETIHLTTIDSPISKTVCGLLMGDDYVTGDETQTGQEATCGTCRRIAKTRALTHPHRQNTLFS